MAFQARAQAAHARAARRFSVDEDGRDLALYWPTTSPTGTTLTKITGVTQGTQNGRNARLAGLAVMESDDVVFCAPLAQFPAAVQPNEGVIFFSGYSDTDRTKWRCNGFRVAGGLVEIDCRRT